MFVTPSNPSLVSRVSSSFNFTLMFTILEFPWQNIINVVVAIKAFHDKVKFRCREKNCWNDLWISTETWQKSNLFVITNDDSAGFISNAADCLSSHDDSLFTPAHELKDCDNRTVIMSSDRFSKLILLCNIRDACHWQTHEKIPWIQH